MSKKSPIVRSVDYPNLPERKYLFKDAKVGDRYRRRDGGTATLVARLPNGRYTSNYFVPDEGGEEYGVLWDGMLCWGTDKHGQWIKSSKDIIEKIE